MPSDTDGRPPAWFTNAMAEPATTGAIEVEGCLIAFRQWGDPAQPGLLLVHGGGAHSRWWDHIAPFFSGRCCVTALDLSGHGDSGRRPSYNLEVWGREIAAVAGLGRSSEPPVVVGHSLGGMATFCSAAEFGDRFEGVIIVDSPVRGLTPEETASLNRQAFGPLRLYPTREHILGAFRTVPEQPIVLPYVVDHVAAHSIRQVPGGWTWKFDPSFFFSLRGIDPAVLARIPCRVAVLRAEFGLVTPDVGEQMYEMLGRTAPVIELPLAYHHVMFDEPIALVTAVRALLADWRHSYAMKGAD